MPHLRDAFPNAEIVGCDPSAESLVVARRENPDCRFTSMDELGTDAKFDLVIASCVFHHIPPQDRQMAIRYCYSRLKEGGHFVIFEHNPINPVTRHLVKNLPLRRGRGSAEHARDGRKTRICICRAIACSSRSSSPRFAPSRIPSLAADGRTVFRLCFQSEADAA